jgi:hypothetical protein
MCAGLIGACLFIHIFHWKDGYITAKPQILVVSKIRVRYFYSKLQFRAL